MPVKKWTDQRGFAALKKTAHHEGEKATQQQKDDDENIRDGRRKIGAEFAFGDGSDIRPGVHKLDGLLDKWIDDDGLARHHVSRLTSAVSGMVILRKTSSSRPSSVCNSSI